MTNKQKYERTVWTHPSVTITVQPLVNGEVVKVADSSAFRCLRCGAAVQFTSGGRAWHCGVTYELVTR